MNDGYFGFITNEDDILTYDTLEKARDMKADYNNNNHVYCSTIMYRPELEELLVILKANNGKRN